MRKVFAVLCFTENVIEVSHVYTNDRIEVCFERGTGDGFDRLYLLLDGTILYRAGYSDEEVEYFIKFVIFSREEIEKQNKN